MAAAAEERDVAHPVRGQVPTWQVRHG
jgi:hypothetical protein